MQGENSTKLQIQDCSCVYIEPSGRINRWRVKELTLHTGNSKHNQGERPDIPNGELYYVKQK